MQTQLLVMIVLVEWILLVTTAAPMFLVGRFTKRPNFGIGLWFALFASVLLAALAALGLAGWSVFETYLSLQQTNEIAPVLLASLAPWLLLGFAGVLLALANQKLEPLFQIGKKADYLALMVPREVFKYRRAKIYELDLPGYYAFTKDKGIYLTEAAFELPGKQLEAILRHEYGHIKLGHQRLKKIAGLALQLMPWFAVSRAFNTELERLCEHAADSYALRRVYSKDLFEARSRFI